VEPGDTERAAGWNRRVERLFARCDYKARISIEIGQVIPNQRLGLFTKVVKIMS